jgi:predicted Fe-Mo cluster-binding NifX family protein
MTMRIAVAAEGPTVSEHFGHCSQFAIFDTVESKVTGELWLDNPGHKPGFLPIFLKDKGVEVVIAGGMGQMAKDLFAEQGIRTVTGAAGAVKDMVEAYLHGVLHDSGAVCDHHEHEHECSHD